MGSNKWQQKKPERQLLGQLACIGMHALAQDLHMLALFMYMSRKGQHRPEDTRARSSVPL